MTLTVFALFWSIARQCELMGLPRSTWYYEPVGETAENLALMRQIDELYLECPFYGSRKIADELGVNRKRVQRLMRRMGLEAIYPKRRTTCRAAGHKIYPYLLRNVEISRPDHVWSTDITHTCRCVKVFLYLVAIMDWYSRYVLSWRLSNTLEGTFCLDALDEALSHTRPNIFNSDQGSQFTAAAFTERLQAHDVAISMDGRGWAQRVYRASMAVGEVRGGVPKGIRKCLGGGRLAGELPRILLPSLGYRTPAEVYFAV